MRGDAAAAAARRCPISRRRQLDWPHNGALQQSSGNIINVTRESLYLGAGGNAVAAGTVSIPGVQYNLNLSDSIFNYLVTRPLLNARSS